MRFSSKVIVVLYCHMKLHNSAPLRLEYKAAAVALGQHPVVNAGCKDGKSFTYNSNMNIAVAVAI